MSENQNIPRASNIRRVLLSALMLAFTLPMGFLYGLFGYYAISYLGLVVGLVWAIGIGLITLSGKLTHPDFTIPLGFFLAAVMLLSALVTAHQWIRSDLQADFDHWYQTETPDLSDEDAWRVFIAESLGSKKVDSGPIDVFRYKAHVGEEHSREGYQEYFQRRGIWAWMCWVTITLFLPIAAYLATLTASYTANRAESPEQQIGQGLQQRSVDQETAQVPEPEPQPSRMDSPAWANWMEISRAYVFGLWRFLPAILATLFANSLSPEPGRGLFIVFAVSGLWVSAALAALEPELFDGFSLRRLGGHFINLVAMLALAVTAVILMMPVIILTSRMDSDPAMYLYFLGMLVTLGRMWPIYMMRYLYRAEDHNPSLDQRGWGFDVVSAWRLTRAPGAFWRSTFWALGSAFVLVSLYDWGRLNLPEAVQTWWGFAALVLILPLAHLVFAERAIALRDAQEIDAVLDIRVAGYHTNGFKS